MKNSLVHIIGGGLAGAEAAWQISKYGGNVRLYEMRPITNTNAHKTDQLAELVCSNSMRSDDPKNNAVGLLHEEMRKADSIIINAADQTKIPAGSALAVDRDMFAQEVTKKIQNQENIEIIREEVTEIPDEWQNVIVATGPLTAKKLAEDITKKTGNSALSFFDAIAPIVHTESINMEVAWFQSRYDKQGPAGTGRDYINCPMDEEQYNSFVRELVNGEKKQSKEWEDVPYFEGCLPVEVMAQRGAETLRYGPMKPRGLTNAHEPNRKSYAVVQLRQDNKLGTLYNIVGFQTQLKHGEQVRIFKMIPGLEDAQFARLGGVHRNTYINSPQLLNQCLQLNGDTRIRFAGQITGCEGYVESAAIGLLAGRFAMSDIRGEEPVLPPETTALGALLNHITNGHIEYSSEQTKEAEGTEESKKSKKIKKTSFQPMNINFGLFPPIQQKDEVRGKKRAIAKKLAVSERALNDVSQWLTQTQP